MAGDLELFTGSYEFAVEGWRTMPVEGWRTMPVEGWRTMPVEGWRTMPVISLRVHLQVRKMQH